ncbi:MAG TPA: SlyX family protein [Rhodocyclaceae bacterium]|nr:SlyX family protein [Rhodocyclaceae bacterium]
MEARLIALETKMNLSEDLLDTLNRTVFRQQQQIDSLQQQIRVLYQQSQTGVPTAEQTPLNETPPHY